MTTICPLCQLNNVYNFHKDNRREYLRCRNCLLVFVPKEFHLSNEDEKARYDIHQNSEDDPGYRKFLSRIFLPMHNRVNPGSFGLDFGSGPGPTLSLMFEEAGHMMEVYDIYYANDKTLLEKEYDFITASEVVEHLKDPLSEIENIWKCLKTDGYLSLMTKMVLNQQAFSKWHYITDLTHISFFSVSTFEWLGRYFNSRPEFVDKDVVIFRKNNY